MFIDKVFLIITLVNIVLSEDTDDDIRVNAYQQKQLPLFTNNHPPFEEYDDFPVLTNQKVKIVRDVNYAQTSASNTRGFDGENLSDLPVSTLKHLKLEKSAIQKDSVIPVNVVYEKNTNVNFKSGSNPSRNKIKRRNQRRQNKGINKNNETTSVLTQQSSQVSVTTEQSPVTRKPELVTSIKPTTTTIANRDVTLFPKRPAEDNIRIKFQKQQRVRPPVVKILDEKNFVYSHTGNFHYSYDSADGTRVSSRGELRNVANEGTGEAVVGSVSYTDQEGNDYSLSYTADENGYRPVGDHLPTPPPIPPAIARALRYLATKNPEAVTELSATNA